MTEVVKTRNTSGLRRGGGRTPGVPNKVSGDVKAMILKALNDAGGAQYLLEQAHKNPKAFLALVGRVLPMQVTGEGGGAIHITVSPKEADL